MSRKTLFLLFVCWLAVASPSRADIFEWEWIDPNDHSLGKRESTTLVPDGAGLNAEPGAYFGNLDLAKAYLSDANLANAWFARATLTDADFTNAQLSRARFSQGELTATDFTGADLTEADFVAATLVNANFSDTNLTGAFFIESTLTNADLTGAIVSGASFANTTSHGFTAAQLYSTASYQTGDLTGIQLWSNDLTGWDFARQNLTNAYFSSATLTDADFTGAIVRGASFYNAQSSGFTADKLYTTASYQAGDLTGIELWYSDLTGWNFAGQDLSTANFYQSTLTNADFTGAIVRGANFSRRFDFFGLAAAQLYSTASYQSGELQGIQLEKNDLTGWNFAGQNLTNAYFYQSTLTDANIAGADTRGARGLIVMPTTIDRNAIRPNGHIVDGLHIVPNESMRLWDYDGGTPIPIVVEHGMSVDPAGTLRAVFDADEWGSKISFEAGIEVTLGGTLLLEFAEGVAVAEQLGRTIDLFDWGGVTPSGVFTVESPYVWDLSTLYTTGEVKLLAVPEPSAVLIALLAALATGTICRQGH